MLYNSMVREAAVHWQIGDFLAMRAALDDCRWDRRGPEYGYLAQQCEQTVQLLGTHTGSVTSLALSADGKRLFSGSSHGTIKVWDLRHNEATKIESKKAE